MAAKIDQRHLPHFSTYLNQQWEGSFSFSNTSPAEVEIIINNFKSKSSTGHDKLSMRLIKNIKSSLAKPLSLIINQSLNTGIFPDKLKKAKVIPIYKKDDEKVLNNYRPISLLPVLSKVFEKVVYCQLYDYFVLHNIFYRSQHGFKKLHSTETAILEFIDRLYKILDSGETPLAIFLYLSKAFDTLDHNILLHKLKYYGISGTPLNWFRSYLTNRSQYVQIDDHSSKPLPITTGVPQGSILGPLLFIIYINDLYLAVPNFESILYADDTTLINSVSTLNFRAQANNNNFSDTINSELKRCIAGLQQTNYPLTYLKPNICYSLFLNGS